MLVKLICFFRSLHTGRKNMAAVIFGWEWEKSCELVCLTFIGIMSFYKITAASGTTLMLKYASSQQECFLRTEDIQSLAMLVPSH